MSRRFRLTTCASKQRMVAYIGGTEDSQIHRRGCGREGGGRVGEQGKEVGESDIRKERGREGIFRESKLHI